MMQGEKINIADRKVLNDYLNMGIESAELDILKKKISMLVEQDTILDEALGKVRDLQDNINKLYIPETLDEAKGIE